MLVIGAVLLFGIACFAAGWFCCRKFGAKADAVVAAAEGQTPKAGG